MSDIQVPYVVKPPRGLDRLGGPPGLVPLPESYFGNTFNWEIGYKPLEVFIGQFSTGDIAAEVYVFGYRLDLSKSGSTNKHFKDGYLMVYSIRWQDQKGLNTQVLRQSSSVTYSATNETNDYVPADDLKKSEMICLKHKPIWKSEICNWPLMNGKMMIFIGQISIPDNPELEILLTSNESIFLFCGHTNDGQLGWNITTQTTDEQTAEEHYALEE